MKKLAFLSLLFSLVFWAPQIALAEFSCSTEIIYKWKPGEEEEVLEESWLKLGKKGELEQELKKSL